MRWTESLVALAILVVLIILAAVKFLPGWWDKKDPGAEEESKSSSRFSFEEVQATAGLDFFHFNSSRVSLLPEDVGSGVGWGDFDNDGDDDLYLVNFAGPFLMDPDELKKRPGNHLYRNEGNGRFHDITADMGVGHAGWDFACLWFDYDDDGWLDLIVTHYSGVVLYRNQEGKSFSETTVDAGLGDINRFLLGVTAGDYDRDGDLDLYLCGYVAFDRQAAANRPMVAGRPAVWTNPVSYPALFNLLLQNQGNGRFEDTTELAGVADPKGKSMSALFCDFDEDGWPDLFVGNDVGTADMLYHNNQDGTFKDVSVQAGTFDRRASMGIAVADVWHRGSMDLFTTHWVAEDHALWKNISREFASEEAPLFFDDIGPKAGITSMKKTADVGWGTGFYDLDNDGHLDLFVANGSTIEDELTLEVLTEPKLMPQKSKVLWNNGEGRFVDQSAGAGDFFDRPMVCHGVAFADFDGDGRIDIAVNRHNGKAILLQNQTKTEHDWVAIELAGVQSNSHGVGAVIQVVAGGVTYTHQRVLGTSYLSNDSYRSHFGLGDVDEIERITIQWPSGATTQLEKIPTNQRIRIAEPDGS